MTNIFDKLYHIEPFEEYPNAILYINFKSACAYLYKSSISDDEVDTSSTFEGTPAFDLLVHTITKLGLDVDGDSVLLNVFIIVRDAVKEEIEKENAQKEENRKIIDSIKNKEVLNLEYYDAFIGRKAIRTYNLKYLTQVFRDFKKIQSLKRQELKWLIRVMGYHKRDNDPLYLPEVYNKDRMEYHAIMGFDYIYNNSEYMRNRTLSTMLSPLAEINPDYCKYKIHILEVELAYIKRNIKALKVEIRERIDEEKSAIAKNSKASKEEIARVFRDKLFQEFLPLSKSERALFGGVVRNHVENTIETTPNISEEEIKNLRESVNLFSKIVLGVDMEDYHVE